jgi:hypothetical protein
MIQQTIYFVIGFIGFVMGLLIIYWLYKMEKCECGNKIAEKKYLKEWFIFSMIYSLCVRIYIETIKSNLSIENLTMLKYLLILTWIIAFISFVMFVRMFIYIRKLKAIKCECGMLMQQNIIYYYQIAYFSIFGIALFISMLAAAYLTYLYLKNMKKTKSSRLPSKLR